VRDHRGAALRLHEACLACFPAPLPRLNHRSGAPLRGNTKEKLAGTKTPRLTTVLKNSHYNVRSTTWQTGRSIPSEQNPCRAPNPDGCAANSSNPSALDRSRARIRDRASDCPTGTLPMRDAHGHPSCDNRGDPSHRRAPVRLLLVAQARPSLTQAPPKRQLKIAQRRNDVYDACRRPPIQKFRSNQAVVSTVHLAPPRECAIPHTRIT
jgi:hypothetical protein